MPKRFDNERSRLHEEALLGGAPMITDIEINNFRCFSRLHVKNCKRINIIVGDNGVGKTSLLEGIFLALGGSTELAFRFRNQRGLDTSLSGSPRLVVDSIFGELFYNGDYRKSISVILNGSGRESRSVSVNPTPAEIPLPLVGDAQATKFTGIGSILPMGLRAVWRDAKGTSREVPFNLGPNNTISFHNTEEILDEFFYISSSHPIASTENASRFSSLSKRFKAEKFEQLFRASFPLIKALSLEVSGASPAIYATIHGSPQKVPLANVSGAINRLIGVLLCVSSSENGVVLVDEMENGVFYEHYEKTWRSILEFTREYNCQIFTTTHSLEWLKALVSAAGNNIDDIALWRMESAQGQPHVLQFSGRTFKAGLETGGEVRGRA